MTRDDIFYQIIAYLNDNDMHGNQGLWDTSEGLVWIWEGRLGWACQWFGNARKWPQ